MRTNPALKVSKASNITKTQSNLLTSQSKSFFYKCLKNTHTVSVFYSLPGVKNAHADIRMLKHECSVNGNIKQTTKSKNFIRITHIFYTHTHLIFYTHILYANRIKDTHLIFYTHILYANRIKDTHMCIKLLLLLVCFVLPFTEHSCFSMRISACAFFTPGKE